jgi:hypothetical protein
MKKFKKKIALLLAVAMLFTMLPVNLFAAPGTVGPPQTRSTQGRTEATGSVMYTARIPMSMMHGFRLERTTVHEGIAGHLLHVSLEGGTNAYPVTFPQNNQWATPYNVPGHPPVATEVWPLNVVDTGVTGVFANQPPPQTTTWDPLRGFNAQFHSWTDTTAWISLGFDLTMDDINAINALEPADEAVARLADMLAAARTQVAPILALAAALDAAADALQLAIDDIQDYMADNGVAGTADTTDVPNALWTSLLQAVANLEGLVYTAPPAATFPAGWSPQIDLTVAALAALATATAPLADLSAAGLGGPNYVASDLTVADLHTAANINAVEGEVVALIAALNAPAVLPAMVTATTNFFAQVALPVEVANPAIPWAGPAEGALRTLLAAAAGPLNDPIIVENPILLTFEPPLADEGYIPSGAGGFLNIEIPVHQVRNNDARMVIRRGGPNGPIVAEGYLLDQAASGVTIEEGGVVLFEHSVQLNPITIRENAPGAITDRLASHDPTGRNRAFAIRLTAPAGYTWERTNPVPGFVSASGANGTPPTFTGTQWSGTTRRVPREFPVDANNQPLYPGPPAPGFPSAPHITSPFDLLQWHCTVDGVYMVGNRQELLIIFDNLTRDPSRLAHVPAELHIQNLRLTAGPAAAPAESEVNIDIHVGIVCAYGFVGFVNAFPNPEPDFECHFGPTPTPSPPASPTPTPGAPPAQNRPEPGTTCPPAAEAPPCVPYSACFYFSNITRFPTNLNQVLRYERPDGDLNFALGWNAVPRIDGSRTNVHVATRVNAGFRVELTGNPVEMRSGAVTAVDNTVIRTGVTQNLRITEIVPGALALAQNRPITFTFPEGVQVVGVNYTIGGGPTVGRQVNETFLHSTQFNGNVVTIANNIPVSATARQLNITFRLSVEAGFAAANNTEDIYVTIDGPGIDLLGANDRDWAVAQVYDPITLTGVEPIQISAADFVGREQNIIHTSIGNEIVIEETRPGALTVDSELWVFVVQRYGIGHPLFISRGTTVIDAETGFGLTVAETRNIGDTNAIRLVVTSESAGEPGRITLQDTTLFGHVYQGEVYYFVVTGNAVAANHTWVAGNVPGAFGSVPYGEYVIEEVAVDAPTPTPEPTPGPRANSIAGHSFNPANELNGAPEMIWYRAPGMNHQGGFVQLRAFADLVGVTEDNINWVGSTRVATIAGWDWNGNWVTITMTQGSPWAQISRGSAEGLRDIEIGTRVDIAEFSDGLTGPTGTVVPVFQNNRIYVPFRFVFNAFGYSADYGLAREGNVARVVPN